MYQQLKNEDEIEMDNFTTRKHPKYQQLGEIEADETEPEPSKPLTSIDLAISIAPIEDDPNTPSLTFRAIFIGTIWCVFLGASNSIFAFRTNPFEIPSFLATLLAYPMGLFMASVLPQRVFKILGFAVELNPGPFSIKEHVLITIIASAGGSLAYGIDNVVAQKSKLFMGNTDITILESLAWVLVTQMLGFGMAGLARRYLVKPKEMIWPGILSTVALFVGFHSKTEQLSSKYVLTRYQFFWIAGSLCFAYSFLPQYFIVALQSVSPLCLIGFGKVANFLFSSDYGYGLGIGSLTFDWYYIRGRALTSPWFYMLIRWATVNSALSNIFWGWILTPILYFTNAFQVDQIPFLKTFKDGTKMPVLNSVSLFNSTGHKITALSLLNKNSFDLNTVEYENNKPILLSTYFALSYFGSFVAITAAFSHVVLWHSGDVIGRFKSALSNRKGPEFDDIHSQIMSNYPDIPDWMFIAFLILLIIFQLFVSSLTAFKMSIPSVLLCIVMSLASILPIGIITAVSGQRLTVNVLTEFVIGYLSPGKTVEVMAFKSLGTNSVIQAITLLADLKLGHYMKINPIHVVLAQLYGSLIGAITNVLATFWAMDALKSTLGSGEWGVTNFTLFYNAGAIWGAIGPDRFFGPGSPYHSIMAGLYIGLLLPAIPWGLNKLYPSKYWRLINVPLLASFNGPGLIQNFYIVPVLVAWVFQYKLRRSNPEWWKRYNYILAIALDSGVGLCVLCVTVLYQNSIHLDPSPLNPAIQAGVPLNYYCFDKSYKP